jgi:hypothetical protein
MVVEQNQVRTLRTRLHETITAAQRRECVMAVRSEQLAGHLEQQRSSSMTRVVNGIALREYGAATLFVQCRRAQMSKPKPEKKPAVAAPALKRMVPMELQLCDRLIDETGEYEVIGRPYTTAAGKTAHVRVKRVDSDATMIRTYGAHERGSVKRAEEGK